MLLICNPNLLCNLLISVLLEHLVLPLIRGVTSSIVLLPIVKASSSEKHNGKAF